MSLTVLFIRGNYSIGYKGPEDDQSPIIRLQQLFLQAALCVTLTPLILNPMLQLSSGSALQCAQSSCENR